MLPCLQVIIALLFGYFISAVIHTDGNRYVTRASYDIAPVSLQGHRS